MSLHYWIWNRTGDLAENCVNLADAVIKKIDETKTKTKTECTEQEEWEFSVHWLMIRQVSIKKGEQIFVFRYLEGQEVDVLLVLTDMAHNAENEFDWYDAAILSYKIGEYKKQKEHGIWCLVIKINTNRQKKLWT